MSNLNHKTVFAIPFTVYEEKDMARAFLTRTAAEEVVEIIRLHVDEDLFVGVHGRTHADEHGDAGTHWIIGIVYPNRVTKYVSFARNFS